MNHTFAICAYKESPYLEACIQSVLAQREDSQVILCTSTPNQLIEGLATKYGLSLHINNAPSSIHGDWNFALSMAKGEYVTLCHQDDIYEPGYCDAVKKAVQKGFLVFFSDYWELRGKNKCSGGKLLLIKRMLLSPLRVKAFQGLRWAKRFALRFGCGICCPSVTFHMPSMPKPLFQAGFKSDLDWQAWEKLSTQRGRFAYEPRRLMCHRIHEESETSRIIGENQRGKEDYQMFLKFWPPFIAKMLTRFYSASEKSNSL
ncbi:MAG: glycosyltransferase family 2 protein [Clostridia bacterium]|nr:glycosyltransferase family 2 protein [Clostridia bacterium]